MVGDPSTDVNLFDLLRVGREGTAFERSLRGLAFLFNGWSLFEDRQQETYEEPDPGVLRVIAFTKLGRHFSKAWNRLSQECRADVEHVLKTGTLEDLRELVTFPSPWQEITGPHGRQPGIYEPGKGPPAYMIDILFAMQKLGKMPYFLITPPDDAPDDPADPRTTIAHGTEDPDDDHFLADFTQREITILKDWRFGLQRLNGFQLRALGTHVDRRETEADIRYELRKAIPHCENIIQDLKAGSCFRDSSYEMSRFAREADRKSAENRRHYEDARASMLDHLQDAGFRAAFADAHKPAGGIWDAGAVPALAAVSGEAWALSRYCHCVSYFRTDRSARSEPRSRESKYFHHTWEECCPELDRFEMGDLPDSVPSVFAGNQGDLKPEVRSRMVALLSGLKSKMTDMARRAKYA